VLDLEANCLSDAAVERIEDVCADVRLADQKDPADERYASVGE
jgi:hypothetical protein